MPTREALPEELAPLADRNALPISDSRFDFDVGRLITAIDKALAEDAPHHAGRSRRTGCKASVLARKQPS